MQLWIILISVSGDGKRRSFTSTLTSVFRRAAQVAQPIRETLESAGEAGSYRYTVLL